MCVCGLGPWQIGIGGRKKEAEQCVQLARGCFPRYRVAKLGKKERRDRDKGEEAEGKRDEAGRYFAPGENQYM